MELNQLLSARCEERPAGTLPLAEAEVTRYLGLVPGWQLQPDGKSIQFVRRCANFLDAVSVLNRIAAEAEVQNHHPDVRIYSYRMLEVAFTTHSIGGLSENDFIMAARINQILAG